MKKNRAESIIDKVIGVGTLERSVIMHVRRNAGRPQTGRIWQRIRILEKKNMLFR